MRLQTLTRRAIALALVMLLVLPVALASADPLVPPALHSLTVTANGTSGVFSLSPTPMAAGGSSIDTAAVTAAVSSWVSAHAAAFAVAPVDARRTLNKKKKRVDFAASKDGAKIDQAASVSAMTARLLADANETNPTGGQLALPVVPVKAKVQGFANTILVVQSRRKIYLYKGTKIIKTYRCAVGQPRYPTPNGSFWIGKKVKMPSWTNGGMQWAAHMPSYIGPGPNNPLGTRAMYVYGPHGDTGVRFHGVPPSENSSIGHAASHGCMRMHRKDVEDFFKRVSVGTAVYIMK